MDETKSLNSRIAEALGWTEIELQSTWSDRPHYGFVEWEALRGVPPGKTEREWIPDWEHSLDAVAEALGHDDVVIQFQPDMPLTFTVHVTSYGSDPRNPSFVASEMDDEWGNAEDGWQHPTLQQLAARALLAYLEWKKDEGEDT